MNEHIHFAYSLSGARRGEPLTTEAAIARELEASDLAWVHLQADDPATAEWIDRNLGYLDRPVRAALLADETRPRAVPIEGGLMLILRGVNTNPGAEPEDMVSLRLWIDPARIVSLSVRPVAATIQLAADVAGPRAPDRAGSFLCRLLDHIADSIEEALEDLEEETAALEDDVTRRANPQLRERITDARRQLLDFRRHIAPQRDALTTLAAARLEWATKSDRRSLHEALDRMVRHVEELDTIRERLTVVRDELTAAQAERLNRNLYLLSVVSAVFLPLMFLTSLMGINLAGMPGAEWRPAFWAFSGLLVAVVALQVFLLRWFRLF